MNDFDLQPSPEQKDANRSALAEAMRRAAGLVAPTEGGPGAAAVAGIRSMLPGGDSYRSELAAYNAEAAPGMGSPRSVVHGDGLSVAGDADETMAALGPFIAAHTVHGPSGSVGDAALAPAEAARVRLEGLGGMKAKTLDYLRRQVEEMQGKMSELTHSDRFEAMSGRTETSDNHYPQRVETAQKIRQSEKEIARIERELSKNPETARALAELRRAQKNEPGAMAAAMDRAKGAQP